MTHDQMVAKMRVGALVLNDSNSAKAVVGMLCKQGRSQPQAVIMSAQTNWETDPDSSYSTLFVSLHRRAFRGEL